MSKKVTSKDPKKAISKETARVSISMHDLQSELPDDIKKFLLDWNNSRAWLHWDTFHPKSYQQ